MGHHWIEIGEIGTDGQWHPNDSYGWWPNWNPDDGFDSSGSAGDAIGGTGGIINGGGDEDPHQGDGPAEGVDRAYNPKMRKPGNAGCDESCEEAAKCLKDFAQSYGENYGAEWNYRFDLDLLGDMSCHSFVERALAECELSKELR